MRLRVTDEFGAVGHLTFNVNVTDVEPVCDLGGPYEVAEGASLAFVTDGIAAGHPSDPIVYYGWDFGDGRQNTGREQNHIFDIDPNAPPANNTYTVTLSLRDIDSPVNSPTTCQTTVRVIDVDPVVTSIGILNPQQQTEGQTVQFDGSAQAGGPRDPLSTYRWTATCVSGRCNEPDSAFVDRTEQGPQMSRLNWAFPEDGRYRICLEVSDEDSTSDELCEEIDIADLSPIATINGPTAANQGDELAFNLRGTIGGGPDDRLNRVVISWGDGSGNETRSLLDLESTNYMVMHTYVQDGQKTISIRAIDEDSQAVATHDVLIRDATPTAVITGPTEAIEGEEIELSALNSLPGSEQDPISEYRWDFDDGQTVVTPAGQQVVRHAFPDDRTYIVRMTVVDIDGSESTATHEVVVQNKAPRVVLVPAEGVTQAPSESVFNLWCKHRDAPIPDDGVARVIALVDDVPADLPPNQSVEVVWNLDDGAGPRPGTIVERTYNELGRKSISVHIEDGDIGGRAQCRGSDGTYSVDNCTFTVQVTPAPPVVIVDEEVTAIEGQELIFTAKVIAPLVGEGMYGELDVRTEGNLPGAVVTVGELQTPEDGAPYKDVTVAWTPSYYEAPIIRPFQVTAFANETSRTKAVSVRVVDGGSPRLATLGGRANLSQLTFYDYSMDPQTRQLRLTPNPPISLGLGVGDIVTGPENRYVWATLPGSNHVAVVDSRPNGRGLVRRVPVGHRPTAITVGGSNLPGGARIWVANQGDNSVSVIDPVSMKLDYRSADDDYRNEFQSRRYRRSG